MSKQRVLSGMQASGRLHLGHLTGVLDIWKKLQEEYECFYFIADWHALSTNYEDTHEIKNNIFEIAVDWLSTGIDPQKSTIFLQSMVAEHAVLHLFLSMITPVPWLERNPAYKEKIQETKGKDLTTYGFLGYPILQASDIMLYKADFVPVGVDQLPHLEMARELARKFNFIYKKKVLKEPAPKLSQVPKLAGTDGRKMSKSYNNAIYLSDPPEVIYAKVKTMITDPQRVRRYDPGDPDICNVYSLHKIYSLSEDIANIYEECKTAGIGCTDCKQMLAKGICDNMQPFHERRAKISSNPKDIYDLLEEGSSRARAIAKDTLQEIKNAMRI